VENSPLLLSKPQTANEESFMEDQQDKQKVPRNAFFGVIYIVCGYVIIAVAAGIVWAAWKHLH
jgi:hypothetical protein